MEGQKHSKDKRKHVQWDQEQLKETQKTRGTFAKIDEPKTPYRSNQDSDEEEESMANEQKSEEEIVLEDNLKKAKKNSHVNGQKRINIAELNAKLKEELEQYHTQEMVDEAEEEEKQKRKEQFKKKRDMHYNEFKRIQEMKNSNWEQDDQE